MSSKPLPLRVAIIGLSASAITSWAASAHLPSLQTTRGCKNYKITALCNSSVAAAQAAIKHYGLDPDTKAYGSPSDLAADPDIDVVICNTRVDRHHETIVDSIKAGKDVYIEWPVTSDVAGTEELLRLAGGSGSRVAVGLQGRWAPAVLKVKEIVESGRVGKVLSSDVRAFGGTVDRTRLPEGLKYFAQRSVGGNPIMIGFGHMIDYYQYALGEFVKGTTYARTQIQRGKIDVFDPETKEVVEIIESDVPDLITVTGTLMTSKYVNEGATLSAHFRRGQAFKGEPSLTWSVNCERGEIRLMVPLGTSLQADGGTYSAPHSLQIHHFENDSVEDAPWSWSSEQEEVDFRARCTMRTLYAFAEGDESGYTSLESAAVRMRQLNAWLNDGRW